MALLNRLAVLGERYLAPLAAPLVHRRHRRTLEEAAVPEAAVRAARQSWWGGDDRWYAGGCPPRLHNRIAPLVDGDAFFSSLYRDLQAARSYVFVAGWCLTPRIPLLRNTADDLVETRLLAVLSAAAQRCPVRVLLWGGAPFVLQPTTRTAEHAARTVNEEGSGDLVCRLDRTPHLTHCHHQKAIVIDGRVAFVGGMDLTTFQGDRWDVPGHPLRAGVNWHDVQLRLEGEAVADVEANFRQRWREAAGEDLPAQETAPGVGVELPAQVLRTIPARTYRFAERGEFGIHHAYLRAIAGAQRFIYLENQYLWSPHVMDALSEAITRRRSEPFRIVIVLPARATSGKWDNDLHVQRLRALDRDDRVVSVYSLYSSGPSSGTRPFLYRPIYVHAKVAIIDDE